MKQQLQQLKQVAARIDALSVRERAMVFAALAAALVFIVNALLLAPMDKTQQRLRDQIAQQQEAGAAIDADIAARVQLAQQDPDAAARERLNAIRQQTGELGQQLLAMEHGLVPPERMGPLVDGILRANGRLKLVSMRTLAAEPLAAPTEAGQGGAPAPAEKGVPLLYRHGVEVTVSGNYLDMVDYMSALEALPTRMFWGRAQLDVDAYPAARLTLTLHTLSLDRQWMKL